MEIHAHLAQLDPSFGSSSLRSRPLGNFQDLVQLRSYPGGEFSSSSGGISSTSSEYARTCTHQRCKAGLSVRAVQNWRARDIKHGSTLDGKFGYLRSVEEHGRSRKPARFLVRSFVDKATATTADAEVEVESQVDSLERTDEEADRIDAGLEDEQQGEPGLTEAQARLRELQEEWDQEVNRYGETEESESDASSSSEEDKYEEMRLGPEKEWSQDDLKKMELLKSFEYQYADERGVLVVKAMRVNQMKITQDLLVDSFAELIGGVFAYRPLLSLTVHQYMRDRYLCLPNAVTLVGFYAPHESNVDMESSVENGFAVPEKWMMAGTVELAFCDLDQADKPAGPPAPKDSPYLCNMAVHGPLRRRGLGRQLLKAAEELTVIMGKEELYLHCRMIDLVPLNMYQGAGFEIVATDSILALLAFQRRRHLLHKKLASISPT